MSAWGHFLKQVQEHLDELDRGGCDLPFFRGHANGSWSLHCGLARRYSLGAKKELETLLYYDFFSQAGPLLQHRASSWDTLFAMQHYGLPTRLLDWSATFAVAVYFALKPFLHLESSSNNSGRPPAIWVLNPFELNQEMIGEPTVLNPETDIIGSYSDIFIAESHKFSGRVMAVNPTQIDRRLAAQRGCFTLHVDLATPLEAMDTKALKQFDIPLDAVDEGLAFLRLAGINEFSVFPDLDGLARRLMTHHLT